MDNSQRQTALVQETTWGTTPTAPGWKLTRETRADGAPASNDSRSPERNPDRMARAMVHGLAAYNVSLEFAWARDAALDLCWENILASTFSANAIKNASTQKPMSMEIKHAGGGTNPYRRFAGILLNTAQISWRIGDAGTISFTGFAKSYTTATSAIASSTYATATPGYDPVTPANITVNSLFGLTSPKVTAFNLTLSNNITPEYAFGSDAPQFMPFGEFDCRGSVSFYLSSVTDFSGFYPRATGQSLDFTIGSVTSFRDQLTIPNCDVWNPAVPDKASQGSDEVTVEFMGKYNAGTTAVMGLARNVT